MFETRNPKCSFFISTAKWKFTMIKKKICVEERNTEGKREKMAMNEGNKKFLKTQLEFFIQFHVY